MPRPPLPSHESRVRKARRVIAQANQNAARHANDESKHRATRTRNAYKVRSDALDRVDEILAGK